MKSLKKVKLGKTYRHITRIVALLLAVVVVGGFVYVQSGYDATEEAKKAAISTENVTVTEDKNGDLVFMPENPTAGMIFYPGAKVEYTAYAPLMQKFAQQGIACVLVDMPLNLAVLDKDAAKGIKENYPEIADWYMAGHSLGGAMAASYTAAHADEYKGLILLAAYAQEDLTETNLQVISLYGSEDQILDMDKYEECKDNLPETTYGLAIGGGCHSYFGDYGEQNGDGEPWIDREKQMDLTVEAILKQIQLQNE